MKMAYLLIVTGLLCLIAGIAVYVHERKANDHAPEVAVRAEENVADAPLPPPSTPETLPEAGPETETVTPAEAPAEEAEKDNYKEFRAKGLEFEKYVVSHFSKKYFTLKEWRGDKESDGVYATSNTYPDMEYTFTLHGQSFDFAVECKWRSRFNAQDRLDWSYKDQLERYRQFAQEKGFPVFVVLGVGGTPDHPAHVYVVPLASIRHTELHRNWLENYRHKVTGNFFYDIPTQSLR